MKSIYFKLIVTGFLILGLSLTLKGNLDNPRIYETDLLQDMGGPFESSNSNSRYALVKSLAEDKSFFLNQNLARFSSPDVSRKNGKYFTTFTPGVSFLATPLYLLGKQLNASQIFTFSINIILAVINFVLIKFILNKLKFGYWSALLSALIFVFATNAFAYAGTLTQHHAVTSGLLFLFFLTLQKQDLVSNILFGFTWGLGTMMDIPFVIMSAPILLSHFLKHIYFNRDGQRLKINWNIFASGIGLLFPILLLGYYNFHTTGSYYVLAQSIGRTSEFSQNMIDVSNEQLAASSSAQKTPRNLFSVYKTRSFIQGIYTLVFSDERSLFYYSPIMAIAILGIYYYLKNGENTILNPIIASIALGLLSYSMFGDPWGGWSFGPRYLIPATALLCLFIPYAIQRYIKSNFASLVIVSLISMSVFINLLGGLTTNLVPPQQEAAFLPERIPHNYSYNWQLIKSGNTHSLPYILWFSKLVTPFQFYLITAGTISLFLSVIYLRNRYEIIK